MSIYPTSKAVELFEWFFREGNDRSEEYQLSLGGWLRNLLEIIEESGHCINLEGQRPALAIWGPSQVGKSTLFADFIDAQADSTGNNSTIQWLDEEPILFERKPDSAGPVLTWNPYNFNADASACITRFTIAEQVEHPEYPVEIKLASSEQLTHALASGYLSECNLEECKGKTIFWDDDNLAELLADVGQKDPHNLGEIYPKLFSVVRVLGYLSEMGGASRFSNVKQSTLSRILDSARNFSSPEAVDEFAFELFWDGSEALTSLWKQMQAKRSEILERLGGRDGKIYCSYEVARLINDMSTYQSCVGGKNLDGEDLQVVEDTKSQIRRISLKKKGEDLVIGFDLNNRLVHEEQDFALVQGIVWEVVVSLRSDRLQNSPSDSFHKLLGKADLLDFPGVAREGSRDDEQKLTTELLLNPATEHLRFSKIIKRGKTACIGVASALSTRIDGFSILSKAMDYFARPEQLYQGVKSWWRSLTGEDFGGASEGTLPLNLVLTFFGELVNEVIANPHNEKFAQAFEKLNSLGNLSNPEIVNVFAVNYSRYGGFRNSLDGDRPATENEIAGARMRMEKEKTVRHFFGSNINSLQKMFNDSDGGVDFFIECLEQQVDNSDLDHIIQARLKSLSRQFANLIKEALPDEPEHDENRRNEIQSWYDNLSALGGTGEKTDKACKALIKIFEIDQERLTPLPRNLREKGIEKARSYVGECLSRWKSDNKNFPELQALCLESDTDLQHQLRYLVESVDLEGFAKWLIENFGSISDRKRQRSCRRFVSIALSDTISGRFETNAKSHQSIDICTEWLRYFSDLSKYNLPPEPTDQIQSPSYHSILQPFLARLLKAKDSNTGVRPHFKSDAWLADFAKNLENGNSGGYPTSSNSAA